MSTEPVSIGNAVTVVFAVFGTLLAKWGIDQDGAKKVAEAIGAVISAVIVVISWWKQRSKVTPLVRPQNDQGVPLVPESQAA